MPQGIPTDDEAKRVFAEEFLRTGSVRLSSKAAGISTCAGYNVARELEDDLTFVLARRKLHAAAIDRGTSALMHAIDIAAERIAAEPRELPVGESGIMIHDKGSEYSRALADLYRSLVAREKQAFDMSPKNASTGPLEVVIRTVQRPETEPDSDGG